MSLDGPQSAGEKHLFMELGHETCAKRPRHEILMQPSAGVQQVPQDPGRGT